MIRWEPPGPYEIVFSTRLGGASAGPYTSLNLGLMTGDEPQRVEENRRRLCGEVGADPARLALNRQMHGTEVNRAVAGSRGVPGDALWSDEPGVPMLKLTADCLPIAIARQNGTAPTLVLVHAGWRGLLEGVVGASVAVIGRRGAACIGPGIGACCYEVGEEVAAPYRERFGADVVRGRKLDLAAAAELALRAAGCSTVERVGLCTACHPQLFFSHRRDGPHTGRQGVIGLVANA